MSPADLPAFLESESVIRELVSGELLFKQGDQAAAVYKVESGRLRLIRRPSTIIW
jgi:CRP-like cAMP-binding protein